MIPAVVVRSLDGAADRSSFDSGELELDRWLREQAGQAQRRKLATVWIASPLEELRAILGYYSLAPFEIRFEDCPPKLRKGLPRYPVPVTLLARLAVAKHFQGKGWGEYLLADALRRSALASRAVPSQAVLVHAKHERAAAFYRKYGFIPFTENERHLYLPMATVEKLVED